MANCLVGGKRILLGTPVVVVGYEARSEDLAEA